MLTLPTKANISPDALNTVKAEVLDLRSQTTTKHTYQAGEVARNGCKLQDVNRARADSLLPQVELSRWDFDVSPLGTMRPSNHQSISHEHQEHERWVM
jgi:hypothetical protein